MSNYHHSLFSTIDIPSTTTKSHYFFILLCRTVMLNQAMRALCLNLKPIKVNVFYHKLSYIKLFIREQI